VVGNDIVIKAESAGDGVFFVMADREKIHNRKNTIQIGVYSGGKKIDAIKTNFMGPGNR